jgi:ABC-type nitrate/sulfonate/bicarbonate transport system substrate-binding protein
LRKLALAASLSIALGAAIAAPVAAQEKLRVGKAAPNAFAFVPLDVGIRTGIFRKHGIEVDASAFGGSAKLHQAMAAASIDIGLGAGTDFVFLVKGAPVKAVAAMAGPPLEMALAVRADGPIKTLADLKDQQIGVSAGSALTGWLISELSRRQGWGPNGIKTGYQGSVAARWAALKTGQIEGSAVDLGSALQAERNGLARVLLRFGDMVKDFHVHAIYATDDLVQKKPEAIRAFLKGWFETIAYMRKHKDETVGIAVQVLNLDRDIAGRSYEAIMASLSDDGKFQAAALATLRRSFVELKLLPAEPELAKYYTEAYLPK